MPVKCQALCFLLACLVLAPAQATRKKIPSTRTPPVPATTTPAPSALQYATSLDTERFMGLWFKVAKTDIPRNTLHTRERIEMLQRYDGTVRVIYTGYHPMDNRWERTEDFMTVALNPSSAATSPPQLANFSISRFGPFGDHYQLLALDANYQWAVIHGPDPQSSFVMARTAEVPRPTRHALDKLATQLHLSPQPLRWDTDKDTPLPH